MNDIFANNKVYEHKRWPWGDEIIIKQTRDNKTKNLVCFSLVFLPPLRQFEKSLRMKFSGETEKDRRVWNGPNFEQTKTRKTLYFPRFFDCKKIDSVNLRPLGGRFFNRSCLTSTFFDTLFSRSPFSIAKLATKRYCTYNDSGFGTFHER